MCLCDKTKSYVVSDMHLKITEGYSCGNPGPCIRVDAYNQLREVLILAGLWDIFSNKPFDDDLAQEILKNV